MKPISAELRPQGSGIGAAAVSDASAGNETLREHMKRVAWSRYVERDNVDEGAK